MTVADLLSPRIHFFTEDILLEGRVVALCAKTGKQLFDTNVNKREHIRKFMECEVLSIWASMKTRNDGGFQGLWVQPVTMLYIIQKEGAQK